MQHLPRSQTRFRVAIPRVNPGSEPDNPCNHLRTSPGWRPWLACGPWRTVPPTHFSRKGQLRTTHANAHQHHGHYHTKHCHAAVRNGLTVELRKGQLNRHTLGCPRVSKGCHRKFRGHNFESCVTNFDKISVFSLRSRKGPRWQISWISTLFGIRSVSDLQNENPTPLTRLAARSAAAGCGLGPKMARQFEVRHCLSPPTSEIHKICTCSDRGPYALLPSLSGTCVLRVSRGGKWSGEWQISIERLERAQVLGGADSRHCRWAPSLITVVYQT